MRPCVWVMLLVFVVIAAGIRAHAPSARATPKAPAPAVNNTPNTTSWVVAGEWMKTQDEAVDSALEKAQSELVSHLRSRDPRLAWTPSVDFIRDHLLKDL